jgi:hypothetical protein
LEYALIGNGRIAQLVFFYPDSGDFHTMTRSDYEQYEAAHPDGIKLDPGMFPESVADDTVDAEHRSGEEGDTEDEGNAEDDAGSDATSEFITSPDGELDYQHEDTFAGPSTPPQHNTWAGDESINPSPYKRPANTEPTTPDRHTTNTIYPTTPTPTSANSTTSDAPPIPTSPYRHRSTHHSWTGLELTTWGDSTYLHPAGTMALHHIDEIHSGISHNLLPRCAWGGYADRSSAPFSSGPELKLTTPVGNEWWLDDGCEEYGYEYVYEEQVEGGYGHECGEGCGKFYHCCEDGHDQDQDRVQDGGGFWMDRRLGEEGPHRLETILEQDEGADGVEEGPVRSPWGLETIIEEDEEDEEIEPVDGDLRDRLAEVVLAECDLHRENAVSGAAGSQGENAVPEESTQGEEKTGEKELPLWMRDPWHVSNMSWADMAEEEEEW